MKHQDWYPYLKTLRRLPDEVVLDMATREFDMDAYDHCLCGWAIRGALSYMDGCTPEEVDSDVVAGQGNGSVPRGLAERYGGEVEAWKTIFVGVQGARLPTIERAFVERVAEACK